MSFAETDSKVAASSFSFPPPADPLLVGGQFEEEKKGLTEKSEEEVHVASQKGAKVIGVFGFGAGHQKLGDKCSVVCDRRY